MFITQQHIDKNRGLLSSEDDQETRAKRYFTELTRQDYANDVTDTHYVHTVDREARYSFPCLQGVDLVYVSRQNDEDVEFITVELID
jgi:uncharacterized protein (DUF2461 family)